MYLNKVLASLVFALVFITPTAQAAGVVSTSPPPFTSQAPLAEWSDQRQQDGCEEASALMAMLWVKNKGAITKINAKKEILAISNFEKKKYGEYRDVGLPDIIKWIFNFYYKYAKVRLVKDIKLADIKNELKAGRIVLLPMNGQALKNPHFKTPGPERHMILVYAYDEKKQEFITNDPGTRYGAAYRYPEKILYGAIRVYSTGYHKKIDKLSKKAMIVLTLSLFHVIIVFYNKSINLSSF
ncbi:MAG: C39 family peptidase [Candidatus Falkowbacteria bacterium]|nr:C39 family peptidase [Candidatus Falkowbacteria bacterium]